ncbi:MAG: phosphotransferase family protein [Acidimicrobiales bacterium]
MSADRTNRIGEGAQAEIFLQPDGTVLKLWRRPDTTGAAIREAEALRLLTPGLGPTLLGETELDGRPGLLMTQVPGDGLAGQLRRRPWQMGNVASVLARTHVRIHALQAPEGLSSVKDHLRTRIETSRLSASTVEEVLALLASLPERERLCHGDFHIGNVLGTLEEPRVIDWPGATSGDPDADVAQTNILHRFAQPREGTTTLERKAVGLGRKVFANRYLTHYLSLRAVDPRRLGHWEVVCAAARLGIGVAEERAGLLHFIDLSLRG